MLAGSRWKKAALAAGVLTATMLCVEAILRVAVPREMFVDPYSDEYFLLRLHAASDAGSEEGGAAIDIEPDSQLGWRSKPLLRQPGPTTTNSKGLRGSREYAYQRTPGVGRIVVLGDSFTYGLGVPDDETYPAQMERMLGAWEVLNLGVNGYATDQQLLSWLAEGVRYEPDLVILGYYLPDFHRNANTIRDGPKPYFEFVNGELELAGVPVPSRQDVLAEGPPIVEGIRLGFLASRAWHRLSDGEAEDSWRLKARLTAAILGELKKSCDTLGVRLVVLTIPHHWPGHLQTPGIERIVTEACRDLGIPVLQFTQALGMVDESQHAQPIYSGNRHWTGFANGIVAERIVAFLRQEGLISH